MLLTHRPVSAEDVLTICDFPQTPQELFFMFPKAQYPLTGYSADYLKHCEVVMNFAKEAGINLADYRMVIYALILIMMMILRPQGLMGVGEIWNLKLRGMPKKA